MVAVPRVMPFAAFFILALALASAAEDELSAQADMSPCELIGYFGYPCQETYMTTEDGYVIEVDNVPHGRSDVTVTGRNGTEGRYPVLFIPPIGGASDVYFLNLPSQAPGFLFADAGFDVWSMNTREVGRYSNHTTLSKDDPEYWKFSFDEIGRYDVASCVDHVLSATGASRLTIVCLSQGVAATMVLLSTRPEYNDKVDLVIAYGPVANVSRVRPPLALLLPFVPQLRVLLFPVSSNGYLTTTGAPSDLLTALCKLLNGGACSVAAVLSTAISAEQLNSTRLSVYVGHYPVGFTFQDFYHYYQMYKAKDFVMYDYGADENQKRYNQREPPAYPLERITTPVALFSSEGDSVADPRDVEYLAARLGEALLMHYVVPQKTSKHNDFAVGIRANDIVHNVAIDVIKRQLEQSS